MFIPQVKVIVPAVGVKVTSTGWLSGRSRRMFSAGKITWVPHSLSLVRVNTTVTG